MPSRPYIRYNLSVKDDTVRVGAAYKPPSAKTAISPAFWRLGRLRDLRYGIGRMRRTRS